MPISQLQEWQSDPEFSALPYQEKRSIFENYFDRELSDDDFLSLPEEDQRQIRGNFLSEHGIEDKPELTLGRAGGALKEGVKDVARTTLQGAGALMQAPEKIARGAAERIAGLAGEPEESVRVGLGSLQPSIETQAGKAVQEAGRAESLVTAPEYEGESSGWMEDFVRSAPQMGTQIIATLAGGPLAGMGLMGLQITGGTYEQAIKAGADPDKALAWGVANAIVQAPLEQIGVSKISKLWAPQKNLIAKLKQIGEAFGTEWLTEFFQQFPDSFTNIFATNPDKATVQNLNTFADQFWQNVKEGAYQGTLTAPWALLGAGGGIGRQNVPRGVSEASPPANIDWDAVVTRAREAHAAGQLSADQIDALKKQAPGDYALELDAILNDTIAERLANGEDPEVVIREETPASSFQAQAGLREQLGQEEVRQAEITSTAEESAGVFQEQEKFILDEIVTGIARSNLGNEQAYIDESIDVGTRAGLDIQKINQAIIEGFRIRGRTDTGEPTLTPPAEVIGEEVRPTTETRSGGTVETEGKPKYVSAKKRPVEQRVTPSVEVPAEETPDMRTPMAQLTGQLSGKRGRWVDERGGLVSEEPPTREMPKVEPSVEVEPTETPQMGVEKKPKEKVETKIEKGWLVHRSSRGRNVFTEFKTPTEAQIYLDKIGKKNAWLESVERDVRSDAPDFPGPWRKVSGTPLDFLANKPEQKAEPGPAGEVEVEETKHGPEVSVDIPKSEAKKLTLKEQKEYLLADIDKAIEVAPDKNDTGEMVRINVPGDGKFGVWNNKETLQAFRKSAQSQWKLGKPSSLITGFPEKTLEQRIEQAIDLYGSPQGAAATIKRQVGQLEDLKEPERKKLDALVNALEERAGQFQKGDIITDGLINGRVEGFGKMMSRHNFINAYQVEILTGREKGKTSLIPIGQAKKVEQPPQAKAEEKPKEPEAEAKPGRAWIKDQWRPITSAREISKGKKKGWVEVESRGKKYVVDKSKVKEWPGEEGKPEVAPQIESSPTFFSQLSRVLESKLPNAGTAEQFRTMVNAWAKKGEFKADELKWSGLDDFLAGKEGKLTKQDVLDYLKANQVEIKEVTKGEVNLPILDAIQQTSDKTWVLAGDIYTHQIILQGQKYRAIRFNPAGEAKTYAETHEELGIFNTLAGAKNAIVSDVKQLSPTGMTETKFSQWQLPGGENYRELLLTLPNPQDSVVKELNAVEDRMDEIAARPAAEHAKHKDEWTKEHDALRARQRELKTKLHSAIGETYKSSHWSEPNVLAHVRFNDRTDADGKKVLFLEEVQSDWHQAGRKKGYREPSGKWGVFFPASGSQISFAQRGERYNSFNTKEEAQNLADKINKEPSWGEHTGFTVGEIMQGGVPSAPFAKTWHELALKRILRYAAENGYDKIAWTPGSVQAERYDLSKQVDEIVVFKTDYPDGTRNYRVLAVKGGTNVIDRGGLKENELADLIGKELAQKAVDTINTGKRASFKGDNLKVGGEGMKGFYDKIIPEYLGKYAKKWGAKVEEIDLLITPTVTKQQMPIPGAGKQPVSVHSIPITASMKESVLTEGQPLFKIEGKAPLRRTLTFEELNSHIDRIIRHWKGAPTVNVVEDYGHLPASVKKAFREKFPDTDAQGMRGIFVGYSDETKPSVFLIGDKIVSLDEAEKTLLHEVIGHYGVRQAFGKNERLDRFMKNVYFAKQKQIDAMVEKYPAYKGYDVTTPEGRMKAADEWFAREVAEKGIDQDPWLKRQWDRFVQIVNDALRTMGFKVTLTDAEIRQALRASVRAVEEGPAKGIQVDSVSAMISGERAPADTNSPEFKKWFGKSKVVDENGKPLVVYHGTAERGLESFDISKVGTVQRSDWGKGFYFTPSKWLAEGYSEDAVIARDEKEKQLWDEYESKAKEFGTTPMNAAIDLGFQSPKYNELSEYADKWKKYRDELRNSKQGQVVSAYLSIKNPLVYQYEGVTDPFLAERAKANGKDGIIIKNRSGDIEEIVAFSPTQIKSIFNRGTWSPEIADISASIQSPEEWAKQFISESQKAPETKAEEKFDEEHQDDTVETFGKLKGFLKARKEGWEPQREDTHWLDKIYSVPLHHFKKVEALGRLFQDGLNRMDNYYSYLNLLTQGPDQKHHTVTIDNFRKQDKEGFKKFQTYLVNRDRNQIGFNVKQNKEDQFELYLKDVKKGTYATEEEAWEAAIQKEVAAYRDAHGDQAADALLAFRRVTHNGFRILMKNMRDTIEKFENAGIPLPQVAIKVEGGKTAKVDLRMALAKMGDMRGYYFPRIRRSGQYMLIAKKEGENPIMEFFDIKGKHLPIALIAPINRRQAELERQGYTVTKDLSPKMPEDVFQMAGEVVAMQATINQALERIHTQGITLEDFGLTKVDRRVKDGTVRDFVVRGPTSKKMTEVFKDFGGKWYSAFAGEDRMWHFVNPGQNFEKRLAKALATQVGLIDQETDVLFAKTLAEQVANVIKARGHRAHMIERADAKGKDVWVGYEEDPALAIAQYARGIAAGEAKKNMALDMVRHFTGTDISWADYKQDMTDQGKEPDYEEYAKMVNERRIHPTDQRHAFNEGKVFMEDMLRNQEHIDRVMGTIKGISVMKYLAGRVAAPVVNLTALVTSAPAAISGYTKTSIPSAIGNIGKAGKLYTQYLMDKKWGNGLISTENKALFEEIESKGWHKAQYNREALSVLESRVGRTWGNLIEYSMAMFGATEQLNRVSTIAGAYYSIKESTPADKFSHEQAIEKAKDISDKAHGVYSKANIPHWARGGGIGPQIAKSFYIFKTFSHNYLLTMKDLGFNEKEAGAALYMAVSPMILAGSGALVGKQIIASIFEALGIGGDDPEEALYQWVYDNAGERGERLVRHGIFGVPGVNLKGSLEIGITDIPTTIKDALGAPGSMFEDLYYGGKSIMRGDILKGTEKLLPNALAAPVRAVREATEGVTTGTNAPVFYGRKPLVSDTVEAIYRGLSFNPSRIAGIREKQWKEKKIEEKYSQMRKDIYAKGKRYYLKPSASRTQSEWIDILNEMKEYNERVRGNKLDKKGIPIITNQMLQENTREAFKPSKKERMRSVEDETED